MASSGVRRLRQSNSGSKQSPVSKSEKAKVAKKIKFLIKNEGFSQREAVGRAFGIIRHERTKKS